MCGIYQVPGMPCFISEQKLRVRDCCRKGNNVVKEVSGEDESGWAQNFFVLLFVGMTEQSLLE